MERDDLNLEPPRALFVVHSHRTGGYFWTLVDPDGAPIAVGSKLHESVYGARTEACALSSLALDGAIHLGDAIAPN